jgi:hypothetical protein
MAVFLPKAEIANEVRQAEEEGAEECKEGGMLEMRVDDAAYQRPIDYFQANWNLSIHIFTMKSFLKRSH